jgi:hypothetical protein
MYQLKKDPYNTRDLIMPYLLQDKEVHDIFDHCYFSPAKNDPNNFFAFLSGEQEKMALSNYFSFLDGVKMVHEEVVNINSDTDLFYTQRVVESLKTFKTGESLDFDDVFNNLSILNYNFDCSDIYYSLTERDCPNAITNNKKCIKILNGTYLNHDCMIHKNGESAVLFDNLKEYITREQSFIDDILEDINGVHNPESIESKLNTAIATFQMIDQKIRSLNTDLNRDFDKMVPGMLENWLDCGVIRDEIKKSFSNVCHHDTETLMKFGDLNFYIIFLGMISANIMFFLTCCYSETPKKRLKSKEDLDDTFEDGNVFDKRSGSSSPEYFKENDKSENLEFKQFGGDFGTFQTPGTNPVQSKSNGKCVYF